MKSISTSLTMRIAYFFCLLKTFIFIHRNELANWDGTLGSIVRRMRNHTPANLCWGRYTVRSAHSHTFDWLATNRADNCYGYLPFVVAVTKFVKASRKQKLYEKKNNIRITNCTRRYRRTCDSENICELSGPSILYAPKILKIVHTMETRTRT